MMRIAILAAAALLTAGQTHAAVTDRSPAGFEIVEKASIAATPDKVYAAIRNLPGWWGDTHTFSGDARNLELDLRQGCLCERLPNGYVRHLEVVYSDGATTVRFSGGMGPLMMTGAAGHLSMVVAPSAAGSELTITYDVGGYAKGGLDKWAEPVDQMWSGQTARLKRFVETGKAD